jgi:hypothetical protein
MLFGLVCHVSHRNHEPAPPQHVIDLGSFYDNLLCFYFSSEPPTENDGPTGVTDADFDSNWDEAIETFDGMDLPEELLRGIYSYGFEKPSAIQQRAIKPTILGRDLIAQAQSGTVCAIGSQTPGAAVIGVAEGRKSHSNTIFRV